MKLIWIATAAAAGYFVAPHVVDILSKQRGASDDVRVIDHQVWDGKAKLIGAGAGAAVAWLVLR